MSSSNQPVMDRGGRKHFAFNVRTGERRELKENDVLRDGEAIETPMMISDSAAVRDAVPPGRVYIQDSAASPRDVALRLFPSADLEGLADHELRRKVVVHKLGDSAARQPDSYVEGAFRTIGPSLLDGSMSKTPAVPTPDKAAVKDAATAAPTPVVDAREQARDAWVADLSTAWMSPAQREAVSKETAAHDSLADAYATMVQDLGNAWKGTGR